MTKCPTIAYNRSENDFQIFDNTVDMAVSLQELERMNITVFSLFHNRSISMTKYVKDFKEIYQYHK